MSKLVDFSNDILGNTNENYQKIIEEKDKLIKSLLNEKKNFKAKVLTLSNQYRKLAEDYDKLYKEIKELKNKDENIELYQKKFTTISNTDEECSFKSFYEEKPNLREEIFFFSRLNNQKEINQSKLNPENFLNLTTKKMSNSEIYKSKDDISYLNKHKTIESNESINILIIRQQINSYSISTDQKR